MRPSDRERVRLEINMSKMPGTPKDDGHYYFMERHDDRPGDYHYSSFSHWAGRQLGAVSK